jgi:hypothetical protein
LIYQLESDGIIVVVNGEWWQHWGNGFQLKKRPKKSLKTKKSFGCDKATNDQFVMDFGLETTSNGGREGAGIEARGGGGGDACFRNITF